MKKLLILHGPNLNLLGLREPDIYGKMTLAEINAQLKNRAKQEDVEVKCFQSNHEGALIEQIHLAYEEKIHYILINPAAFTHTSIGIRDALAAVKIPFIEIHLSNIYQRESFRQHSYFSDIAQGVISGLGWQSYLLALEFVLAKMHISPTSAQTIS